MIPETSDMVIISLNIFIIIILFFSHIQLHKSNCRGQLISKTNTSDGHTHTRQAKLSIREGKQPFEQ